MRRTHARTPRLNHLHWGSGYETGVMLGEGDTPGMTLSMTIVLVWHHVIYWHFSLSPGYSIRCKLLWLQIEAPCECDVCKCTGTRSCGCSGNYNFFQTICVVLRSAAHWTPCIAEMSNDEQKRNETLVAIRI